MLELSPASEDIDAEDGVPGVQSLPGQWNEFAGRIF